MKQTQERENKIDILGIKPSYTEMIRPILIIFCHRHQISTFWWYQGLFTPPGHVQSEAYGKDKAPDPRVQRMTENLLKRFIKNNLDDK